MGLLSRESLRAAVAAVSSLPRETHEIAELGGSVVVRGMSAKERDRVVDRARIIKGRRRGEIDPAIFRAQVLLICVLGEGDAPLLEPSDIELLTGLPSKVVDGLMGVVNRLSGFGDEAERDLGNDSASEAATDGSALSSPSH